jgi:hypothetical protein
MHKEKRGPYRAYLLRCWQEGEPTPGEEPHWRFSIEEVLLKRRRRAFSSVQALAAFLKIELDDLNNEQADRS